MFNRKDRQIANLSQMVINRDKLIDTLQEATSNNYNNAETVLNKINELVTTAINN